MVTMRHACLGVENGYCAKKKMAEFRVMKNRENSLLRCVWLS
jgi:hypothetical protein